MPWTLAALAECLNLVFDGDPTTPLARAGSLANAEGDCLAFLARGDRIDELRSTAAGAVIVSPECREVSPVPVLLADNPYAAYARAARLLHPEASFSPGVSREAAVARGAHVAEGAHVGAHAVIEEGSVIETDAVIEASAYVGSGVRIGAHARLGPGTIIRQGSVIGAGCRIQPGAVIGADGFGFANEGGRWIPIPQVGRAVLGDDVHVGANTTVDRGAVDDTVIGDGVILDNQIQIAHNVRIGEHTAVAGCVGIAGSTVIGRRCAIGGGAGIVGHLEITDDVQITAMSLVTHSITRSGTYSAVVPLMSNAQWRRNAVRFRQLDDMARRLRNLERRLGVDQDGTSAGSDEH